MTLAGLVASARAVTTSVAIVWSAAPAGSVSVERGQLAALHAPAGGKAAAAAFELPAGQPGRLVADIDGTLADDETGTLVTVRAAGSAFTFRLRDVDAQYPIYLPAFGAAVTSANDARSFAEIATSVRQRGLRTKVEATEAAPEEDFAHAAANTRAMRLETWLGLSRDARIFRVDDRLQWIKPRFHWSESKLPETGGKPVVYEFQFGRGWGVRDDVTRRLEDGVLPILHGHIGDEDVQYDVTVFTGLERSPLTPATLRGTPFLVADSYGAGHMFTPADGVDHERLLGAAPAAITRAAAEMLEPPFGEFGGLPAVDRLAAEAGSWPELAKDCVAFANALGGQLLIGIEDGEELPPQAQRWPPGSRPQ